MCAIVTVTVTVTVTGTAGVKESLLGLDSWIAAAEEVSLQTASEGGKRRCRRDVLRQTVPNTRYSSVKHSGWHVWTRDHTVLPAIRTFIHMIWNEPSRGIMTVPTHPVK